MQQVERKKAARQSLGWIGQAVSGVLLIVVVLLHMLLHHFQAQGLLSANEVIEQVSTTSNLILEILFVIFVTYHALLGVRAIIFDLNISEEARRRVATAITIIGVLTVIYGIIIAFLIRAQVPV